MNFVLKSIIWVPILLIVSCGSNYDKSHYKDTMKSIDAKYKKGEYSEVIEIIEEMGSDYDKDKAVSWYKTESIKKDKINRIKTKKSIKRNTNIIGFIALGIAILIGIGSTPKQDKRFKTGYKNNEIPDYTITGIVFGISLVVFAVGYSIYFLYGLILGV